MLHPAVRVTILRSVMGHHLEHIGEGIGLLPIFSLFDDFLALLPLTKIYTYSTNSLHNLQTEITMHNYEYLMVLCDLFKLSVSIT